MPTSVRFVCSFLGSWRLRELAGASRAPSYAGRSAPSPEQILEESLSLEQLLVRLTYEELRYVAARCRVRSDETELARDDLVAGVLCFARTKDLGQLPRRSPRTGAPLKTA